MSVSSYGQGIAYLDIIQAATLSNTLSYTQDAKPTTAKRISKAFARAAEEGRPTFVAYIVAGYPSVDQTVDILLALESGGVDVIELGIPFTDPLADGPTIQAAHVTALENETDIDTCMEIVSNARARGLQAPVLFMGYYNPIMQYGESDLVKN
ncbi:hypothetical protein LPJ72_000079, partial [Coemansia sp. Benny D160-2]